jgi:aminomethyltransferase
MIRGWFHAHASGFDVHIRDISDRFCIALQGPASAEIMERLCPDALNLEFFYLTVTELAGCRCWVSRSGYTGEDGFEIIGMPGDAVTVWDALLNAGRDAGLVPCGLGARDTLRMEKCFLLSGQDFHNDRTPLETTFDFAIKWDHEFIGKEPLLEQRERGDYDLWSAILLERRCVPRHGDRILVNGEEVARVTSGTLSPVLKKGIALAFLPRDLAKVGTEVEIEIRSSVVRGQVVKKPFV